ncbi:AAA family ATPase [Candidatus Leptofilum sp.]|uniref:AAA family ATPase n=1 Tax=Candidatus Leptofilum sp. TaxID=3241576 RepID=UPI003B5AEFAD
MPDTTTQLFIQMSGAPGSGKTTLARVIAPEIGAIIIDHDITKTALLQANVDPLLAGKASYSVLASLANDLLQQGHSVIFDSPCFYEELLKNGQQMAKHAGAAYGYIECVVGDLAVLDGRLCNRTPLPSQVTAVFQTITDGNGKQHAGEALFQNWIANMKRPQNNYLILDTNQPIENCLDNAMAYLQTIQTS